MSRAEWEKSWGFGHSINRIDRIKMGKFLNIHNSVNSVNHVS